MYGLGIDVCEVRRFTVLVDKDAFLKRVFSENELAYCLPKKSKAQCLAARFAAKEAFSKAFGTGIRNGISFNEIEVKNDELGKPSICLYGKTKELVFKDGKKNILLSISHEKTVVVAVVVIE